MPDFTPNFNLAKPTPPEFYNIGIFNNNASVIDRILGGLTTMPKLHKVSVEIRQNAWGRTESIPRLWCRNTRTTEYPWDWGSSPYMTLNEQSGYWEGYIPVGFNAIQIFCDKRSGVNYNWNLTGLEEIIIPPYIQNILLVQNVHENKVAVFDADNEKQIVFFQFDIDEQPSEIHCYSGSFTGAPDNKVEVPCGSLGFVPFFNASNGEQKNALCVFGIPKTDRDGNRIDDYYFDIPKIGYTSQFVMASQGYNDSIVVWRKSGINTIAKFDGTNDPAFMNWLNPIKTDDVQNKAVTPEKLSFSVLPIIKDDTPYSFPDTYYNKFTTPGIYQIDNPTGKNEVLTVTKPSSKSLVFQQLQQYGKTMFRSAWSNDGETFPLSDWTPWAAVESDEGTFTLKTKASEKSAEGIWVKRGSKIQIIVNGMPWTIPPGVGGNDSVADIYESQLIGLPFTPKYNMSVVAVEKTYGISVNLNVQKSNNSLDIIPPKYIHSTLGLINLPLEQLGAETKLNIAFEYEAE